MENETIKKIKELIEANENYLILENGKIIESFGFSSLSFNKNAKVKLIHIITLDTLIDIEVLENVSLELTEIFYEVKNEVQLTINLKLKKNSHLDLLSFRKSLNSKILTNVNTYQEASSYINNKNIYLYQGESVFKYDSFLEEKATSNITNVMINNSCATQDFFLRVVHKKEDSLSTINTFGICKQKSLLNINTYGVINKGAKRSSLSQKSKGLLLDGYANISANPWLQIDEFDCLASHGASIGAIDDEELYYLMSRGLSKEVSEKLIVEGFISPVLSSIESKNLLDYINKIISESL